MTREVTGVYKDRVIDLVVGWPPGFAVDIQNGKSAQRWSVTGQLDRPDVKRLMQQNQDVVRLTHVPTKVGPIGQPVVEDHWAVRWPQLGSDQWDSLIEALPILEERVSNELDEQAQAVLVVREQAELGSAGPAIRELTQ